MNATKLRYVLIGIIALLIVGSVAGVWLMQQFLRDQVRITDHAKIDATVSGQEIEKLRQLQVELADKKDLIARTKQIAASAEQYSYQDQVINDLTIYANRDGFSINSFDFSQAAGAAAPSGKTAFVVTLSSPIPYDRFLQFMRDVEQNLTKIQVTSITLSPNPQNPQEIVNPSLSLEVFLKS